MARLRHRLDRVSVVRQSVGVTKRDPARGGVEVHENDRSESTRTVGREIDRVVDRLIDPVIDDSNPDRSQTCNRNSQVGSREARETRRRDVAQHSGHSSNRIAVPCKCYANRRGAALVRPAHVIFFSRIALEWTRGSQGTHAAAGWPGVPLTLARCSCRVNRNHYCPLTASQEIRACATTAPRGALPPASRAWCRIAGIGGRGRRRGFPASWRYMNDV